MDASISNALIGLGGVILGYLINHILNKEKEIESNKNQIKRENYKRFSKLIIEILGGEKISNKNESNRQKDYVKKIYEFYEDYMLYASPKVILSFGARMQYLYTGGDNAKENFMLLSNIIKEMRKELGLSNKGLGEKGEKLFEALIKDYQKEFK